MDPLIGIKGRDFVLVSAETSIMNSYLVMKRGEDKFSTVGNTTMVYSGDQGDAFRTADLVREELKFQELEGTFKVSPKVVSSCLQNAIYTKLRRNPLKCSFMVGGMSRNTPELYSVDPYGTTYDEKFMAMGIGTYFCYGILDNNYKEDLSVEEGLKLLKECYNVLKERCVLSFDNVTVKVITTSGIEETSLKL